MHPHHDIVVSGQAGKEAIVCLYDATRRRSEGSSVHGSEEEEGTRTAPVSGAAAAAVAAPTVFLRELTLGKKETRGVRKCSKPAGTAQTESEKRKSEI